MSAAGSAQQAPARLFIALWPDAGVRDALQRWQAAWGPALVSASPVRPERLHLTLHFLGDVAVDRLPALMAALALPLTPFELRFGHTEMWPHGVAVLRPDPVPEELLQLHGALRTALQALALRTENRPFRPHVTLARRAGGATPPSLGPALRWPVRGHALVMSETGPAGGYRVLKQWP